MASIELLKINLSPHLRPSLHIYQYGTAQNKKENGEGVSTLQRYMYINKDRHVGHLDVTLLNELSAFGKTFKQQIVNSSPKYCIS